MPTENYFTQLQTFKKQQILNSLFTAHKPISTHLLKQLLFIHHLSEKEIERLFATIFANSGYKTQVFNIPEQPTINFVIQKKNATDSCYLVHVQKSSTQTMIEQNMLQQFYLNKNRYKLPTSQFYLISMTSFAKKIHAVAQESSIVIIEFKDLFFFIAQHHLSLIYNQYTAIQYANKLTKIEPFETKKRKIQTYHCSQCAMILVVKKTAAKCYYLACIHDQHQDDYSGPTCAHCKQKLILTSLKQQQFAFICSNAQYSDHCRKNILYITNIET